MVSILLNCTTQTVAMLITAWVLALLILPLRAAIVKFVPVSAFKFMEKVNLETDESRYGNELDNSGSERQYEQGKDPCGDKHSHCLCSAVKKNTNHFDLCKPDKCNLHTHFKNENDPEVFILNNIGENVKLIAIDSAVEHIYEIH
jgi:hypothetical protein